MTKRDVNLDAVFYSGSRARTSNLNMYAQNEASAGLPTDTDAFCCYLLHLHPLTILLGFPKAFLYLISQFLILKYSIALHGYQRA